MKIIDYELIRLQYAVFFGKEVKVTTSSYPKKSAIWKVLVGLIGLIGLVGLVGLIGLIGLVGLVGLIGLIGFVGLMTALAQEESFFRR